MTEQGTATEERGQIVQHLRQRSAEESTALAPQVVGPPSPGEWQAMRQQAGAIAKTEFVPAAFRGRPDAVLAAIMVGRELGIGPMQALQSIAILDGKPNLSAELQRALVARRGHSIVPLEVSREKAVLKGVRGDTGQEVTVTWTIDDAVAAGLCQRDKDGKVIARSRNDAPMPWERYTRQMLVARATSELASLLFPDVLVGVSYTSDELSDGTVVAAEDIGTDIVDGETVLDDEPPPETAGATAPTDALVTEPHRRRLWAAVKAADHSKTYLKATLEALRVEKDWKDKPEDKLVGEALRRVVKGRFKRESSKDLLDVEALELIADFETAAKPKEQAS